MEEQDKARSRKSRGHKSTTSTHKYGEGRSDSSTLVERELRDSKVLLNVGGMKYETTFSTLERIRDSMFSMLVSPRNNPLEKTDFFIDRSYS
eukprot:TRINITY_DN3963_c0_g1_i7.p1 TRINITY_DN3963_c0_g1~~TRINITY_DN3963_c0_g1_i7.p1  ORF type:complete len:101 (-),score=21.26 TRINITY_DN3963_c0_g1_i7:340-615(-)